jgi:hypothetical protein
VPQKPAKGYRTNGELYEYSERMENSFDVLAANLEQIRVWSERMKEKEGKGNESPK